MRTAFASNPLTPRDWAAIWRFAARTMGRRTNPRHALPARPSAARPSREQAHGEPEFFVQWFGQGPEGLRELRPIRVPDAEAALTCVEAMPGPIRRAVAFRVDRPGDRSERVSIIATRDRVA